MMSSSKILVVDDEPEWYSIFLEPLAEAFQVEFKDSADDAILYMQSHNDIKGFVVDIMMPPPKGTNFGVYESLETGVFLIERFRDYIINNSCPVIVVTNRDSDSIHKRLLDVNLPYNLLMVRSKSDFSKRPILLAILMKQLIDSTQ